MSDQAMVIPIGKKAVMAVVAEAGAGVIVGLEQIGLEQIDSMRMQQGNLKDDMQWEAAQNVVPIAQSVVAILMATMVKRGTIRKIGSLLIAPSVTMATYRGAKFIPARLTVTAHRISNQRSINAARQNAGVRTPPGPGTSSPLTWTPTTIMAS